MSLLANRQFGYGGSDLLRGQVFERQYLRGDEKLIKHGYMSDVGTVKEKQHCDSCGRDFVNDSYYIAHHGYCKSIQASSAPITKLEDEFPGGIKVNAEDPSRLTAARR